jgi:ubiquinol-cytochrome c reductase cytochrome c1 subunit
MKELKIFGVITFFTLVTYWGVEPIAHSIFHPHVEPADFQFKDLEAITTTTNSDVAKGKDLTSQNCIGCHSINKEGISAQVDKQTAIDSYGVFPPDLSTSGFIYESNYLANFIKHPVKAGKLEHKYDGVNKFYIMPDYNWMSNEDIHSIVAYFKSIAPTTLTNKEVFIDACGRCHNMKYDKVKADSDVTKIMGSTPPDLSMMIRSRGEHYLETFINDPQKHLKGTAMLRIGLNESAQKQVIKYLEEIGDSKKAEREAIAPYVLGFLGFMIFVSLLWKREVWSQVK